MTGALGLPDVNQAIREKREEYYKVGNLIAVFNNF